VDRTIKEPLLRSKKFKTKWGKTPGGPGRGNETEQHKKQCMNPIDKGRGALERHLKVLKKRVDYTSMGDHVMFQNNSKKITDSFPCIWYRF